MLTILEIGSYAVAVTGMLLALFLVLHMVERTLDKVCRVYTSMRAVAGYWIHREKFHEWQRIQQGLEDAPLPPPEGVV